MVNEMNTLFFRSKLVSTHWDTWMYFYQGTYYLYYLFEKNGHWDGFGVATSLDGVSWRDYGPVIFASEQMVHFLGTGSVWKSPDFSHNGQFICNYSEWQLDSLGKKRQRILFAVSKDLLRWEKQEGLVFDIDETLYEPYGRWDCIYTIPRPEGGYFGTWTATPRGRGSLNGGIGLGYSVDGLHWVALPPPEVIPGMDESGAIHLFGKEYFAMFGTFENGLQMHSYHSSSIQGPFVVCKKNDLFLSSGTYFSRFFPVLDTVLVNHHAISNFKSQSGFYHCYMAPLKRVEIIKGNLYLTYFEANDNLKTNAMIGKKDWAVNSSLIIEGNCSVKESMVIFHQNGKTEINFNRDELSIIDGNVQRLISAPFVSIEAPKVRVLLRESVFEIYYDRFYMTSFSMSGAFLGKMVVPPTFTVWESINT